VATTGVTNPVPGIEAAFRSKPEVIYLVTDGDFPDNGAVVWFVNRLNAQKRVRVNIILYLSKTTPEGDVSTAFLTRMRQLASDNGGQFRTVTANEVP
jgi:hypothetical protein